LQHLQLAFGRVPEGEIISEAVVRGLLGTENEDLVFTAMRAAGAGDLTQTLAAAAKLGAEVDPEIALAELEQLAREVLICAAVGKIPPSLSTTPAHDDLIVLTSNHLHAQGAARLLDEIGNAMLAVRAGADPRVRLELALAKTADPSLSPVSEQTQRRLDRLEGAVASRTYSRRPT
jgi:DNA polymerase III gamma/tau subunit